jgi:hypothetical protein
VTLDSAICLALRRIVFCSSKSINSALTQTQRWYIDTPVGPLPGPAGQCAGPCTRRGTSVRWHNCVVSCNLQPAVRGARAGAGRAAAGAGRSDGIMAHHLHAGAAVWVRRPAAGVQNGVTAAASEWLPAVVTSADEGGAAAVALEGSGEVVACAPADIELRGDDSCVQVGTCGGGTRVMRTVVAMMRAHAFAAARMRGGWHMRVWGSLLDRRARPVPLSPRPLCALRRHWGALLAGWEGAPRQAPRPAPRAAATARSAAQSHLPPSQ